MRPPGNTQDDYWRAVLPVQHIRRDMMAFLRFTDSAKLRHRHRALRFAQLASLAVMGALLFSCRWYGDYTVGNREYKREEYPYSIVRYQRFLEKYPRREKSWLPPVSWGRSFTNGRRETALVRLAGSYVAIRDFYDAQNVLAQYEAEFPKGRLQAKAQELKAEVARVFDARQKKVALEFALAHKETERLRAELAAKPNDADILVALGNSHWKMGQYKSAGDAYLKAIEVKPELRDDPLMLERLIFDMKGNLVPVTSREQLVAMRREREPLVIEGVHEYASRGISDFFASRRRFYMVTGTVRNRSTRPILGVQIEVTLYDSLEQLLEVGQASIGTLYPQQSRPFVIRSGLDAETMGNVTRYRCRALFQQ